MTTTSQLFSGHLSSSQFLQLFSTALKVVPIPSHLSSTLFTSSLLFSTLLNDSHLCPPRLNSSQLFSPFVPSSTLPTSSHLRSTHLTSFSAHLNSFSAHLNSSHLQSQRCLHTVQASTRRSIYTHSKLLHRETLTHRSF